MFVYWIINIFGDLDIVGEVFGGILLVGGVGRFYVVFFVSFYIFFLILFEEFIFWFWYWVYFVGGECVGWCS